MSDVTTIHLIRHGEVHNPEKIYYGRLPGFYLSDCGRLQAAATAQLLTTHKLDAIYTSPMERAIETAEIIVQQQDGLALQESDTIKEVYSPFDGQPISSMVARTWDIYSGTEAPYEQPADVLKRVLDYVDQVRQQHSGQRVALVTHGDIVMFMTLWANALPLHAETTQNFYPEYLGHASISTCTYRTDAAAEIPTLEYVTSP